MDPAPDGQLDLQAAADELGVHYQTAYRWVRTGRLDAKLVGGRYLVAQADIQRLAQERQRPRARSAPRALRLDHAADRLYDALLQGDETSSTKIVRRLVAEGAPIIDLLQDVLVPPLRRIGQGWHDGTVTIWEEHRSSCIVERLLGQIAPNPRGRRRGVAAVAAVAGDHHSVPTTMAAVALRADNWQVHHLGADLPSREITTFCAQNAVTLAVITVTNPECRRLAGRTADELRAGGTPTLVGGPGEALTQLVDLARHAGR